MNLRFSDSVLHFYTSASALWARPSREEDAQHGSRRSKMRTVSATVRQTGLLALGLAAGCSNNTQSEQYLPPSAKFIATVNLDQLPPAVPSALKADTDGNSSLPAESNTSTTKLGGILAKVRKWKTDAISSEPQLKEAADALAKCELSLMTTRSFTIAGDEKSNSLAIIESKNIGRFENVSCAVEALSSLSDTNKGQLLQHKAGSKTGNKVFAVETWELVGQADDHREQGLAFPLDNHRLLFVREGWSAEVSQLVKTPGPKLEQHSTLSHATTKLNQALKASKQTRDNSLIWSIGMIPQVPVPFLNLPTEGAQSWSGFMSLTGSETDGSDLRFGPSQFRVEFDRESQADNAYKQVQNYLTGPMRIAAKLMGSDSNPAVAMLDFLNTRVEGKDFIVELHARDQAKQN